MRKPPLLHRPWIFVSHSTMDIAKVRLIRNYLERAGAEPLLFRLKFLDNRPRSIRTLLEAEMRARQIFLLCNSHNAQGSRWVKQEIEYILSQPNKIRYLIDLDQPKRWKVPRTEINALLRDATVILNYACTSRHRIKELIASVVAADLFVDDADEPRLETSPGDIAHSSLDDLRKVREAYERCYVLDTDERWLRKDPSRALLGANWIVLRGGLSEQVGELVRSLREVDSAHWPYVGKMT